MERVYEGGREGVVALKGVSFEAARGDFLALMGPSGCGKSTLLHLIGGMDRPTRGRVHVAGRALDRMTDPELARYRRTEVGFVFQFFNLLPTLNVSENVALPLLLDGAPVREAEARARELLDRVGLGRRTGHFPAELSGGEMQRTAVARAIAGRPQLVLADEPTGNLDSENGAEMMRLLAELNAELEVTVVLATHSLEDARYACCILRMRDGRIAQELDHADLA